MKSRIVGLLVIVTLYWGYSKFFSALPVIPQAAWNSLTLYPEDESDPCAGKKRCVGVYIAPWCPACKQSMPFIQALRQASAETSDVGITVIVGQDTQPKVDAMAEAIGGAVMLDYSNDFTRAAGVRGVPTWLVWDENRKILKKFSSGAPSGGTKDQLVKWFAKNHLDLEEYFK